MTCRKPKCVEGIEPDQCDHSSTGGRCDVCGVATDDEVRIVCRHGDWFDCPICDWNDRLRTEAS